MHTILLQNSMNTVILADRQDITAEGVRRVFETMGVQQIFKVDDKTELIEMLCRYPDAIVVLDFTLFDINDADELVVLHERFQNVRWVLFSVDLSSEMVRRVAVRPCFSVLLKECSLHEIRECLQMTCQHSRYVCHSMMEQLLVPAHRDVEECSLTKTETEILVDIAHGMTTKEIAEKRYSSFHTVNTHRKNIFRKLGVNTIHEATKYALRAGLIDAADYYI